MEFAFTEEQLMIRDTAESFLAEVSTSEAIRSAMATDSGYDSALWERICTDLCWQALHIPEDCGGLGLGYVELVAMMEQMGRYLLCSPFFSTVCLAANALIVAGTPEQKADYLTRIAMGATATLAYTGQDASKRGGEWGCDAVGLTVERSADGFVLDGTLRYVPDGAGAEILVVAARSAGSSGDQGVSLFVIPADTAGIERKWLPTMDQTRKQAELVFSRVNLPATSLMGTEGEAGPNLTRIIDLANVALAAEQVGCAQRVLDMAVDYSKERVQFNRPVASFQAIKHKAADMMTRVEVARSGVYYAACVAQEAMEQGAMAAELPDAASIAKSYAADACFLNAGDSLQIHGGVGFTWEYDVQLFFKRAKASEHFLGNSAWHRERLARQLLD